MKHFYISSIKGISGISKYSRDFYESVLQQRGYIFIDSSENSTVIMSTISSRDHAHIEIGIFQKKEIEILFLMLRSNYKNVTVTLHDAPLFKYPFFEFKNPLLNSISKACEKYGNSFGAATPYIKKLKTIYVLTKRGVQETRRKYKVDNVLYLPHIMSPAALENNDTQNNNFIYFGFVGRNKGLEYSLQLHESILHTHPDVNFYIVGTSLGKQQLYYNSLREKYTTNVHFLGYIPEDQLNSVFNNATFALLFFKNYKFYCPASGSLLNSLARNKVILTNKANAITEIIEDRKNGLFLSGDIAKDTRILLQILSDRQLITSLKREAHNYLIQHHSAEVVNKEFQH